MPLIGVVVVESLSFVALFGMTALPLLCAIEATRQRNAAGAPHSLAVQST